MRGHCGAKRLLYESLEEKLPNCLDLAVEDYMAHGTWRRVLA